MFAAIAALGALSCRQLNPAFCASHPADLDCAQVDGIAIDAGSCTMDEVCAAPTPVCDLASAMCVQCEPGRTAACTDAAPVCGDDHRCHGCAVDADCESQTCLPDATCASPLDVLYASPSGTDMATCMPADHCSLARAISLIDGTKSTIRLDPETYNLMSTFVLPNDLHLVGRGAVLDRNASGIGGTLDLAAGAHVAIDYVTVQGGDGAAGFGIRCTNGGLILRAVTVLGNSGPGITSSGCTLAISGSQIQDNQGMGVSATGGDLAITRTIVLHNRSGGVAVTAATYDLENDVIAKNGDPDSSFGGVQIAQITSAPHHVFAFNTVAQNQSVSGTVPGVVCGLVTAALGLSSSIVADNGAAAQVTGAGCFWTYSDIRPVPAPGTGDLSSDPLFVDPVHNNFHLQVASPARDAADPAAALAVDLDGDARPQGAGRDMGADEIK